MTLFSILLIVKVKILIMSHSIIQEFQIFLGSVIQSGNKTLEACVGSSSCFEVVFSDTNFTDSIFISSNIDKVFPGATISQNSFFSPVIATLCYTVDTISNISNSILAIFTEK